jgi:AraC family transcriptional activator of pobA
LIMNQLFQIFKLTLKDVRPFLAHGEATHTHDYEELIVGLEGGMTHFIDFTSESVKAPFISFIAKGKVHRLIPEIINRKFSCWVLQFKSDLIPKTSFHLYSYYNDHANILMEKGNCFKRMVMLTETMYDELQQHNPNYAVLSHLLSAMFEIIETKRNVLFSANEHFQKTQSITFKNFLNILEENFYRPEGIEYYAGKLFMSARNLNLICQSIMHKSVSEIITMRKMMEAKNLLTNTNKTVSEIGFEIGYKEKAYFSSVFKRKSGQTPTGFRKQMAKLIS